MADDRRFTGLKVTISSSREKKSLLMNFCMDGQIKSLVKTKHCQSHYMEWSHIRVILPEKE